MQISRNMDIDDLPQYLSPQELQEWLALGRSTTYELLRSGEIPSVRFGRLIRVPKTGLKNYLNECGGVKS